MLDCLHVVIGKVAKAQGLTGELKLIPFSGEPGDFCSFQEIILARGADLQTYTVERCRSHGKFAVVKLREIVDRNDAEAQIGAEVLVLKNQMPVLSADEFYWHDMVGMRVLTEQGQELGEVTSLIATGANDVLVVTGHDQEYLIPVLQEIIVRQDKEAGILVISPMAGLLEMNLPDAS
ncbi:MAG: ribosome maturation factor RimM [Desulfobulbaceae bacterium]|nr:ribosome maturation factor RimM [Desulfobulbaceae bacterium]